jgi:acetoin utilization deacetylase AcuC-like enzyme
MSIYKTKTIAVVVEGGYTLRKLAEQLPTILEANDEPDWEVCTVVTAQLITTPPFQIVIIYRKKS